MVNDVRCSNCGKKLAENLDGKVEIVCPRCHMFQKYECKYQKEIKVVDKAEIKC